MDLLRGPADRQRHARHAPRRGAGLQGRLPALPDHEGLPRPPQGRLGLPRPAGRARGREGARLHRQAATSRRTASPSSTPAAASRCCGTSTRSTRMTERMGYWVDIDRRLLDHGPGLRRVASGGRSSRSSTRACWSRTTGSRRTARAAAPACPTTSSRQGYETVVDPSVYVRFPLTSGPLRGHGADLLVWTTTPWTLVSNTARRGQPRRRLRRRARRTARPLVVAEPLLEAVLGEGWTVEVGPVHRPRAGALGPTSGRSTWSTIPGAALRGPGRLRHHRGRHRPGAPGPRVRRRRPRRQPGVRPAGRQPGRAATATSTPTCRWSAGCSSRRPTSALVADLRGARAAVPARALRALATRTAGAATRRCSTTRCRPGTSARPRSRTQLLRRERADQLVPRDDQARPLRRLAAQQRRLGAVPRPLLGHPAAASGAARTSHLTCVGSLAELGTLAGRTCRPGPAPAVRRRRRRSPARRAGPRPRRVPEVIDAWYDSGSMPFAQWGYPHAGSQDEFERSYPADFICEAIDQTRGWFYTLMAVGTLVFDRSSYGNVRLPRPHPRRGRPQDEQAPGQHPGAHRR